MTWSLVGVFALSPDSASNPGVVEVSRHLGGAEGQHGDPQKSPRPERRRKQADGRDQGKHPASASDGALTGCLFAWKFGHTVAGSADAND